MKFVKLLASFTILLLFVLPIRQIQAQEFGKSFKDYELVAIYVYNIAEYVTWPKSSESVLLCTHGNDLVTELVEKIIDAKNSPYQVTQIENISLQSINECNLLYLHEDNAILQKEFVTIANNHQILTIGDTQDFVKDGGAVGISFVEGNPILQANLPILNQSNIIIDSELLELMEIVE